MQSHRHNIRIVIELSRYSGFFLTNWEIYDVIIMSISTESRVHFTIYLLNTKSLGHDNWSTNTYVQYCAIMTIFLEIFYITWSIVHSDQCIQERSRIFRLSLHMTENQLIVALRQKYFSSGGNLYVALRQYHYLKARNKKTLFEGAAINMCSAKTCCELRSKPWENACKRVHFLVYC